MMCTPPFAHGTRAPRYAPEHRRSSGAPAASPVTSRQQMPRRSALEENPRKCQSTRNGQTRGRTGAQEKKRTTWERKVKKLVRVFAARSSARRLSRPPRRVQRHRSTAPQTRTRCPRARSSLYRRQQAPRRAGAGGETRAAACARKQKRAVYTAPENPFTGVAVYTPAARRHIVSRRGLRRPRRLFFHAARPEPSRVTGNTVANSVKPEATG